MSSFNFSYAFSVMQEGLASLLSSLIVAGPSVFILACFVAFGLAVLIYQMPMPGVRCPRCAEREIEQ